MCEEGSPLAGSGTPHKHALRVCLLAELHGLSVSCFLDSQATLGCRAGGGSRGHTEMPSWGFLRSPENAGEETLNLSSHQDHLEICENCGFVRTPSRDSNPVALGALPYSKICYLSKLLPIPQVFPMRAILGHTLRTTIRSDTMGASGLEVRRS